MNKALIIETSNFLWLTIAACATWRVIIWKTSNRLDDHEHRVVSAWIWVFVSAAGNHGWFALSRHLSPEGERWHPLLFEWRWAAVLITALGFGWGMAKFVQLIDGYTNLQMVGFGLLSTAFAIALGYF